MVRPGLFQRAMLLAGQFRARRLRPLASEQKTLMGPCSLARARSSDLRRPGLLARARSSSHAARGCSRADLVAVASAQVCSPC